MLRTLQKQKIKEILEPENTPFKILILDEYIQDLLSAIFKVSDLRDSGVTAHFLLSKYRTPIKDIPAVYFISSFRGLSDDLIKDLYSSYHLNISSSFKRSELEELALKLSEKQNALKVKSIHDQFIDFVSLQEDLFTLNIKESLTVKDDPEILRKICLGLFSIFVTLKECPFIVSQNSQIGKMLDQKIQNTKIIKPTIKKPLVIIVDREFDLVTPFYHQMGYIELIHDIFNIENNKVEIVKKGVKEVINIDTDCEFFKETHFEDFPAVAERVDRELLSYKKEMALRSITDKSDKNAIQEALNNAPHLQKRNEIINSNLNLCMNVLEEVKKRKLDDFYAMEQEFNKDEIMELAEKGTDNDIIRLCISLLNTKNSDLIDPILSKRGIKVKCIDEIKKSIKVEDGFKERFKKWIFKKSLPICSYVEEVLGQIKSQNLSSLNFYDPAGTGVFLSEISRIVVFVNGGITYTELKALKDIEKSYKIPVIGGGTEIINAESLLKQINGQD